METSYISYKLNALILIFCTLFIFYILNTMEKLFFFFGSSFFCPIKCLYFRKKSYIFPIFKTQTAYISYQIFKKVAGMPGRYILNKNNKYFEYITLKFVIIYLASYF
jgi:hypothetical protein